MMQVECRQARLRKIQAKTSSNSTSVVNDDDTTPSPEAHHIIGKTENFPDDVGFFVQENEGDPAIKVQITYCFSIDYH
jgi:hypothetical protein